MAACSGAISDAVGTGGASFDGGSATGFHSGTIVSEDGSTTSSDDSDDPGTVTDAGHLADGAPVGAGSRDTGATVGPPPPPHTVGACAKLGGVDVFEDITPPGASLAANGIVRLLLDAAHSGTLYVGTDHSGLLKSTDCGSTWSKVNTGRNASVLDSGILWSMSIDPIYPNIIYAGSLYGSNLGLMKSTNGGVDWDPLFTPGATVANAVGSEIFFQDLSMDPTDHTHVVVSFHIDCTGGGSYGKDCMAQTNNSGSAWSVFPGPLASWTEGAGPVVFGPTTWLLSSPQNGVFYTADTGAHWEKVAPGASGVAYRTADHRYYYMGGLFGVTRSTDGHLWTNVASIHPNGLVGDGTRMFAGLRDSNGDQQPYYTSPESDGATWTPLPSPKMAHGGKDMAYDADHHLLYSANTSSGLWRMVTR